MVRLARPVMGYDLLDAVRSRTLRAVDLPPGQPAV
jgi:hypothetical protein